MKVEVLPEAAAYAREHGGVIYIWASASGLMHVDTAPPPTADDWQRHSVDDVEVALSPSLPEMTFWRVGCRRFPRRRLVAVSNMTSSAGESGTTGIL